MTEDEFARLASAGYNRVPLVLETFADLDTPLSIYLKLANQPYSYLLESVVGGERFGRRDRPVGDAFGCHRDAMVVAGAVDAHVPAAAGGDQVAAFAACEVQLQVGTGFSVCVAGASGRPLEL